MISDKLKKIAAAKAEIAALEKSIATELNSELAALPGKYGFSTVKAFAKAVMAAVGGTGKVSSGAKAQATRGKNRTRAVITDAIRGAVKKLVEEGKSGAAIANELKISLPSVQNIKKALGLVKARK